MGRFVDLFNASTDFFLTETVMGVSPHLDKYDGQEMVDFINQTLRGNVYDEYMEEDVPLLDDEGRRIYEMRLAVEQSDAERLYLSSVLNSKRLVTTRFFHFQYESDALLFKLRFPDMILT